MKSLLTLSLNGETISTHELEIGKVYSIGREEGCDIRLDNAAISRRHVSIESFDGLTWTVKRLSRHGKLLRGSENLESCEISFQQEVQIPPYTMVLTESEEQKAVSRSHLTESTPQPPLTDAPGRPSSQRALPPPDQDISDSTQIQIFTPRTISTEVPYLLIENPQGEIARLRLEGEQWIIGRDEALAQILIPDLKCSRRHLQLRMNRGEYFIEDLASTQGTELNDKVLEAHHVQPFYSGDVLRVGDYKITFELHDSKFENQLRQLPAELLAPISADDYPSEADAQLPMFGDPTDFVLPVKKRKPVDFLNPKTLSTLPKKYLAAFASVAFFILYLAANGSGGKGSIHATSQTSQSQDPFERLTSEQKQYIISSYNLGDTFMKRRNYDAALREFQKIHELVPSYQKSRDYEDAARHAMEAVAQKTALQEELRKENEVNRQIVDILAQCEARMSSFRNQAQLDACLLAINDLDPSNKQAEALRSKYQDEEVKRDQTRDAREAILGGIKRGENLFKKAQDLKRSGQIQSAIAAFQTHLSSSGADPKGLKEQSRREIASLQSNLRTQTDSLIRDANTMLAANQLKEASAKLDKVLLMDPQNEKAKGLRTKVKNDMSHRMKVIYGDSILLESLGNIDEAREKWKTIVKSDLTDGEYYIKAKSKISKYGDR